MINLINIDKKSKKIVFSRPFQEGFEALPILEFDLISCFICPKCDSVLLAYFKTNKKVDVWCYEDVKEKKYGNKHYGYDIIKRVTNQEESDYKHFFVPGAQGIETYSHNFPLGEYRDTDCVKPYHNLSFKHNLIDLFIKIVDDKNVIIPDFNVDLSKISVLNDKGFVFINDLCKREQPMIIFENKTGIEEKKIDYDDFKMIVKNDEGQDEEKINWDAYREAEKVEEKRVYDLKMKWINEIIEMVKT